MWTPRGSLRGYIHGVRRALTPPDAARADAVLAVALLAAKVILMSTGIQPGAAPASYLVAPFLTLPLAWRRRHPTAVAWVVMAAAVAENTAIGYRPSVVDLAVYVLVPYSLGAHCPRLRGMLAGLVIAAAAAGSAELAQSHRGGAAALWRTAAGDVALLAVPFLLGLALRQQRLRAEAMERLAEQLDREREERARTAVAAERARIARELHDEVAHAMSVIAVQADAAEAALARDPALVQRPLLAIRDTARQALADMRRVLGALRSDETAPRGGQPGLASLGSLLEQASATGLDVDLRVEGEPVPVTPPVDLAVFRALQEGLTNVRKHARAKSVAIVLRYGHDTVGVEICDDGDGRGSGGGSGHGLTGIRERVSLLGGEFSAGPREHGYALRVTLPLS